MPNEERTVAATLPEDAWSRIEATFFTDAMEEAAPESPIVAEDGSNWTYGYFETPKGIGISLVRWSASHVIAFALHPEARDIMTLNMTRSLSEKQINDEADFQHQLGMTIPNQRDLAPLISFLLPNA